MPYKRVEYRDLNMFYCLNPDPLQFLDASPENLPESRPLKEGLPILVLVHSAGGNVCSWFAQLSDPRLAGAYNIIALDCRFHGFTTGGERTSHTLENSAECVIATLDELGYERYSVFGDQVLGSVIASWIAIKRPEKVQSLILSSPGWKCEPPEIQEALRSVSTALLSNKPGRGGDDTGTLPDEALEDILAYHLGPSSSFERLSPIRPILKMKFQERYGTGHSAHDTYWLFTSVIERKPIPQELMSTIKCPVLILRGSEDKIVSPETAAEEWKEALVNAKNPHIVCIAGAPSLISLSDPNIVNRIITRFLQRALGKE
ncbi:alpha/beta fold hydrolase [Sporobolomyces salmoneus]|uniref:alpha/beta fold hydrolase n=1 Tax=Sporobolomyces salmoneus TaxID=183962 RepID=UPI0031708878